MTEILLHLARTLNRQFQSPVDISKRKCPSKIGKALERRSLMLFRSIDLQRVLPLSVTLGCHRALVIGSSDNRVLRVCQIPKFHHPIIPKQPLKKRFKQWKNKIVIADAIMTKVKRKRNLGSAALWCFAIRQIQMGLPCINFRQMKNFFDNGFLLCVRKGNLIHGDQVLATFVATILCRKIIMGTA